MLTLRLKKDNTVLLERSHPTETYLALKRREYQEGEVIELLVDKENQFVWVQVDEAIEPSLIYLTKKTWEYPVILDERLRLAYSPKIFTGDRHYLRAWLPTTKEIEA